MRASASITPGMRSFRFPFPSSSTRRASLAIPILAFGRLFPCRCIDSMTWSLVRRVGLSHSVKEADLTSAQTWDVEICPFASLFDHWKFSRRKASHNSLACSSSTAPFCEYLQHFCEDPAAIPRQPRRSPSDWRQFHLGRVLRLDCWKSHRQIDSYAVL